MAAAPTPFALTPPGFFSANEALNALPIEIVQQLVSDGHKVIAHEIQSIPEGHYRKMLPESQLQTSLRNAINATLYILRALIASGEKDPKALNQILERETDLSKAVRAKFALSFASQDADANEKKSLLKRTLRVGKLVDIQWKLGMGISSNTCTALKAPFVSMVLSIADQDRQVKKYPLELSIEEFHDFRNTFKQMAIQIEQV